MTSHVKLTLHQTSSFAPVLQPIMRGTPLKLLDCNRNSFYLKFSAALSTTIYMVITGPLRSNFAKKYAEVVCMEILTASVPNRFLTS